MKKLILSLSLVGAIALLLSVTNIQAQSSGTTSNNALNFTGNASLTYALSTTSGNVVAASGPLVITTSATSYTAGGGANLTTQSGNGTLVTTNGVAITLPNLAGPVQNAADLVLSANQAIATNTTPVALNVTAPTFTGGHQYTIEFQLPYNGTTTGGASIAMNGTATATTIFLHAESTSPGTAGGFTNDATAIGTAVNGTSALGGYNILKGFCTVTINVTGTLLPYIAQSASNSTATTFIAGGFVKWHQDN